MSALGIQAWALLLSGVRIGSWHSNVVELLEVLRVLGNSYRLASVGGSSCVFLGRFALGFFRTVVAANTGKLTWRMTALQALRGFRIRNATLNIARHRFG